MTDLLSALDKNTFIYHSFKKIIRQFFSHGDEAFPAMGQAY